MSNKRNNKAKIPEVVIASTFISFSLIFGLLIQLEGTSPVLKELRPHIPAFLIVMIITILFSIFSLWTEEENKFEFFVATTSALFILIMIILGFFAILILS